jgi:hypothetical protein
MHLQSVRACVCVRTQMRARHMRTCARTYTYQEGDDAPGRPSFHGRTAGPL